MNYQNTKKLNPTLKEVRFNEYLLLCEGNVIRYAFLLEYLHRNKYIGCQHLHSSCVANIQLAFDKGQTKPFKRSEQLSLI